MNRIVLFLATNLAVVVMLSAVLAILGFNQPGNDMLGFVIIAAVFGMGGSFIALMMSKSLAIRATRAQRIERPRDALEQWLLETVHAQSARAGIGTPEVAIFDSAVPNAFATGADRDHALVAVSSGLLQRMSRAETAAVIGHEISHVANGDMVTLSLIQGVVNTFVMVFARIVALALSRGDARGGGGGGVGYFLGYLIAQTVLGLLASIIVTWFSRHREFRADAGGAELAGRGNMIAALERLQAGGPAGALPDSMAAFGISGGIGAGLARLLATHPPLSARIEALRNA